MRKLLCTIGAALAMTAAAPVTAALIDFDTPGVITVDNVTSLATYTEDGFSLTGNAAGFLPIDFVGSDMSGGLVLFSGNSISLTAGNGSLFDFSGLDAARFDPATPAILSLTGIFGNNSQLSVMLALGELASPQIMDWTGLSELRLSANADLVIDNVQVSPVPEPDTVAMLLLGMGTLVALRSGRLRRAIGKR